MLEPKDVRIDTWCSNLSNWLIKPHDTCRLKHLPTGIIIERTARSIHKAKAEAWNELERQVALYTLYTTELVDEPLSKIANEYYEATQTLQ